MRDVILLIVLVVISDVCFWHAGKATADKWYAQHLVMPVNNWGFYERLRTSPGCPNNCTDDDWKTVWPARVGTDGSIECYAKDKPKK
jgi:hypothetical protein